MQPLNLGAASTLIWGQYERYIIEFFDEREYHNMIYKTLPIPSVWNLFFVIWNLKQNQLFINRRQPYSHNGYISKWTSCLKNKRVDSANDCV